MRRLTGIVFSLILICSIVIGLAAAPVVEDNFGSLGYVKVYPNEPEVIFTINSPESYNWQLYRQNDSQTGWQAVVDRTDYGMSTGGNNVVGPTSVYWDYLLDGDFTSGDDGYEHMLSAQVTGEQSATEVPFYVIWMNHFSYDLVSHDNYIDDGTEPDDGTELPEEPIVPIVPIVTYKWYPNNTACAFGPQYRNVKPSLTDKWYMFTPIDLGQQGVQTYELVASNMYVIGEVEVNVEGDSVVVNYRHFYGKGANTFTKQEFFTVFSDLDAVTSVEPEDMPDNPFKFGEAFSIQNDLQGDTNVLLYVRNLVTYRDYATKEAKLTRFWPNITWRRDLRNQMLGMMDPYTK